MKTRLRLSAVLIVGLLAVSVILGGCQSEQSPAQQAEQQNPQHKDKRGD